MGPWNGTLLAQLEITEEFMKLVPLTNRVWLLACSLLLIFPRALPSQTTTISTEYLMTIYAPLDPVRGVDSRLYIYNVRDGGWVKGPKINGTIIAPSGIGCALCLRAFHGWMCG
jgi:hypothetical protein